MLRTTPGETTVCRGTGTVCSPHGHPHFVWGPRLDRTLHAWLRNAASTSRSRIPFTTRMTLSPLDIKGKGGLDCGTSRRQGVVEVHSIWTTAGDAVDAVRNWLIDVMTAEQRRRDDH